MAVSEFAGSENLVPSLHYRSLVALQRAQKGLKSALSVPVASRRVLPDPFVLDGTDRTFNHGHRDQQKLGCGEDVKGGTLTRSLPYRVARFSEKVHVELDHRGRRVVRG